MNAIHKPQLEDHSQVAGVVHAEVLAAAFDNIALTMPLLHLPTTVNMF